MPRSRGEIFTTVRSEGALLPPDFLQRLVEVDDGVPGLTPEAYHLAGNERLHEAISRSWNRLLGVWAAFQTTTNDLPSTDPGIGITREKWLLPLFQELGYGRLLAAKTSEVEGKPYPISHLWNRTPVHLVGRNVDLERRSPGVAGAAKVSPHGLVQEFLNRSSEHLWGLLSNGLRLRILRESKSLTRQAYVEFDLAGMMEGQVYADFALLWLLCHQSRVEADRPEQSWLERWSEAARAQGTRALEDLRKGVEKAIEALGRGFLAYPGNAGVREKLQSGGLAKQDYYRQLLRTVYRLIFLFVAEDRDLLLTARPGSAERDRYLRFYSADRFRTLAERRRGSPHADLWQGLRLVFGKLSSDTGCPELGLPALGSFLWSAKATPDLDGCDLANSDLLDTVRALAFIVDRGIRRGIDYKNLGAEELGSVYESLLELHPDLNPTAASFALTTAAGHERKITGSYYTPSSLIECLLDSALEPVLDEAAKQSDPEKAILGLKLCDPACGSGHFLIAAAHRLANHLAAGRTGDEEPPPGAVRRAMRDVVGRCLYGVDLNPMAVELCKVNLWIEALEPGKPLSFLDHHIRVGNSLLGATPELIAAGLPDDAFTAIEGDDKKVCSALKRRNKQEHEGQRDMVHLMVAEPTVEYNSIEARTRGIDEAPDNTIDEVQHKAEQFRRLVVSPEYQHAQDIADAWCAAFVWKKETNAAFEAITTDTIRRLQADPNAFTPAQHREVERLSSQYQFFHWHLAFPEVFAKGGFDCVLGNPPWEKLTLMESEFFASRDADIAAITNKAARGRAIEALMKENLDLHAQWLLARRSSSGSTSLVQRSGRFPRSAAGELNTYLAFTELGSQIVGPMGRAGLVVKSSIFTADTATPLLSELTSQNRLVSLFDFRNWEGLFPGVGYHERFSLVTLTGLSTPVGSTRYAFYCDRVSQLNEAGRVYSISRDEIALLSPNSGTCPTLTTKPDLELMLRVCTRFPVLVDERTGANSWSVVYGSLFHMSGASDLYRTREQQDQVQADRPAFALYDGEPHVPLYEGKFIQIYDHRFSSFEGIPAADRFGKKPGTHNPTQVQKDDPGYAIVPRYWIPLPVARDRAVKHLGGVEYYCAARRVTNVISNARTVMACVMPLYPANDMVIAFKLQADDRVHYGPKCALFISLLNSFPFDYFARLRVAENLLKNVFHEIPAPTLADLLMMTWPGDAAASFVREVIWRSVELTYTAWDLEPFARDCGWSDPPFRWDEERRFLLRCELDAAFFHLYGIARDDADYIMETFPIVKRKDEAKYGDYRTKLLILDIYDRMQEAIATGRPYQTILDPPPADPSVAHGVTKQ